MRDELTGEISKTGHDAGEGRPIHEEKFSVWIFTAVASGLFARRKKLKRIGWTGGVSGTAASFAANSGPYVHGFMLQKLCALRLGCYLRLAVGQLVLAGAVQADSGGLDMAVSSANTGGSASVSASFVSSGSAGLGALADRMGNGKNSAAVHRRWSPRDLRFGLREAWCMAAPKEVPSGPVKSVANLDPPGPWREDEACLANCSTWPYAGSPSAWATLPRLIQCGGAGLGLEGKRRSSDEFGAKPRGDPRTMPYPSAAQVVQYFLEALDERPICEGRDVVVFQRTECLGWGVSWRRGMVEVLPFGVAVRWLANDDFGLSELREFFEAAFFNAADTERFYRWLAEGGWHQEPIGGGMTLKMGVLRGRRATLVEISWQRGL